MRSDLAHADFFTNWPISRHTLMLYDAFLGFAPSMLAGAVALLLAGLLGGGWQAIWPWLLLWPLLVAVTALAATIEMRLRLRTWPATPETVPDLGPASLTAAGLVWLAVALYISALVR
jgi:hypothetical protein